LTLDIEKYCNLEINNRLTVEKRPEPLHSYLTDSLSFP